MGYPALFIGVVIGHGQGCLVLKRGGGVGKVHTVFSEVLGCLVGISFDHLKIICTFVHIRQGRVAA